MTREEKLYSMTMKALVEEAEKIGVKIDKKGSKQKAVEKMLAAEAKLAEAADVAEEEAPAVVTETEAPAAETEAPAAETEAPAEKKERKPRQKTEMTEDAKALHEYVLKTCEDLGGAVFVPAKDMKFRGLKAGVHMFVKYSWTSKAVVLQVRAEALGLEKPQHPCNHTFNDKYVFTENTEEARAEILRIMKTCYDWQVRKNTEKAKKAEKKTAKKKNKKAE